MYNFSIVIMCNIMQMYPRIFGALGTKMRKKLGIKDKLQ